MWGTFRTERISAPTSVHEFGLSEFGTVGSAADTAFAAGDFRHVIVIVGAGTAHWL